MCAVPFSRVSLHLPCSSMPLPFSISSNFSKWPIQLIPQEDTALSIIRTTTTSTSPLPTILPTESALQTVPQAQPVFSTVGQLQAYLVQLTVTLSFKLSCILRIPQELPWVFTVYRQILSFNKSYWREQVYRRCSTSWQHTSQSEYQCFAESCWEYLAYCFSLVCQSACPIQVSSWDQHAV